MLLAHNVLHIVYVSIKAILSVENEMDLQLLLDTAYTCLKTLTLLISLAGLRSFQFQ